jgi:glycosyltransferase involved in cell wall biosynthesis
MAGQVCDTGQVDNIVGRTALVCIYADPENYPPTLNGITVLSERFEQVFVLGIGSSVTSWQFPSNCTIKKLEGPSGKRGVFHMIRSIHKRRLFEKAIAYILAERQPELFLCYDDIAVYAGWNAKHRVAWRGSFWFHNHDAADPERVSRRSTLGLSLACQPEIFSELDVFSLPAMERRRFFPMDRLKGEEVFVPNYPELSFYAKFGSRHHNLNEKTIRLIYQGSISGGHGLEETLPILERSFAELSITLTLVGPVRDEYRDSLVEEARRHGVEDRVEFLGSVPYRLLPYITRAHSIGIAIHMPKDIVYSTGGTASNKIYEYGACGLPVLAFDSSHYRDHLEKYRWVSFVDGTEESFLIAIQHIVDNYSDLSNQAVRDFQNRVNFRSGFTRALNLALDTN